MGTENSRVRWLCKKAARRGVALGTAAISSLENSSSNTCVRVLTYHRFGEAIRDPFCVSSRDFEAQMAFLAENDLALSLHQLSEYISGQSTLSGTRVLVTIDDGLMSLYSLALPVLRHFNIPAVAFVSPGLIDAQDTTNATAATVEPYISWEHTDALAAANIAIGSHAMTHRSLASLPSTELDIEVRHSKELIEQRTGSPATSFAYPFGTYADFSRTTAAAVRNAGYTCAFTSQHGTVGVNTDKLELPRIKVEGGEGLKMFRRIVDGGLDAWRVIDRALWRLQASGP